jgi:hypothetical protein
MGLNVSGKEGGSYTPAPAGNHLGVCVRVLDLGTQTGGQYGPKHKVMISWELSEERITYTDKDGNAQEGPYIVSKKYNLTLGGKDKPSMLRADLESWRGKAFTPEEEKAFDLVSLVGVPALISVVHELGSNGNTYANVKGVARLPRGMAAPWPEGKTIFFSFSDWDGHESPQVHPKLLELLQATPEWQAKADLGNALGGGPTDDIPF